MHCGQVLPILSECFLARNLIRGVKIYSMKILVVCQFYYPEQFRITDICEELVKRGHEVTVLTGLPNYPEGYVLKDYKNGKKRDEIINGVKVHRCFEIGRRKNVIFRVLNYYSFALSAKRYAKRLKEEFDVVLVNQLSPIMMANAGIAYKKKHGVKLVMYCLDLWPASLSAGGIGSKSIVHKYFKKVSEKIYKQADKLLITSKRFAQYFEQEFGMVDNIEYLPQYSEEMFSPDNCKKEQSKEIDLLFAGNVGSAQSMDTILDCAKITADISNLTYHIVGDGSELQRCRKRAESESINSVVFYGRKELNEMPDYYKKADAMLVTLVDDANLARTLPGKVQTYMAAGKPIIGCANGETSDIILDAGCGYCSKAQDAFCMAENVRALCVDKENGRLEQFGKLARKYYEDNFSKQIFFEKLESVLKQYSSEKESNKVHDESSSN